MMTVSKPYYDDRPFFIESWAEACVDKIVCCDDDEQQGENYN